MGNQNSNLNQQNQEQKKRTPMQTNQIAGEQQKPKRTKKPKTAAEIDRFWNFISKQEEESAELILYGDISSYSWWGDEITPDIFNKELKEIGTVKKLMVRINSGGGDVFAANAIYTRLKELSENGTDVNIKIDGWAGSAATIIACAGTITEIPGNGVYMIHNPKTGILGYYEASELVKMAEELEIIKQSIVNCYRLKTGKDDEELKKLMDSSTWYTGEQAVTEKFCDTLMFENADTEVENAEKVIVNNVSMNLTDFENVPENLLNYVNSFDNKKPITNNKEDKKKMTLEEFKTQHEELFNQVQNEAQATAVKNAAETERKRMQEIDNLTIPGFENLANEAKYTNPISAEQFAKNLLMAQKEQGNQFLNDRSTDINNSGMLGVPQDSNNGIGGDTDPFGDIIDSMHPKKN